MSLRLLACAALFFAVSAPAEAGLLGGRKKLPTPIRYTAERVDRSPHIGGIVKHPPQAYSRPAWGSHFGVGNYTPKPIMPFLLHHDR